VAVRTTQDLNFQEFIMGILIIFVVAATFFLMLASWREWLDLWIQNQCKDWEILINAPTYPTQKTGVN
jgi:hypothetical protein